MKAFSIIVAFVILSYCEAASDRKIFEDFKRKFNKEYDSDDDEKHAMVNVLKNQREIDDHNKLYEQGKVSYITGLFEHSDMSKEEMDKFLAGYDEEESDEHERSKRGFATFHNGHFPTGPASINWTEKGIVSPVGSQKHCGSCWTFSTTGVVESYLLKKGIKMQVSQQQLIDCETYKAKGCKGGHPRLGLEYIRDNGISKLSDYPYEANEGECKYEKKMKAATIDQVVFIKTAGNETFMRDVVALAGPVSIAICLTEKFRHYHGGVFHIEDCCEDNKIGQHAPIVVGYGNDPKHGPYWLVKNSWGTTWGVNGFGKIRRGKNMCNIARHVVYAI